MRARSALPLLALLMSLGATPASAGEAEDWNVWANTDYDYCDAEALARYWGGSVEEAKFRIGHKVANGDDAIVQSDLDAAAQQGIVGCDEAPYVETRVEEADAFFESAYSYCDAKMIAAHWGSDPYEAKVAISSKITGGYGDLVPPLLAEAGVTARAQGISCAFWETSYDYSDAELLSRLWKTDVDEAKLRIAALVSQGKQAKVEKARAKAHKKFGN